MLIQAWKRNPTRMTPFVRLIGSVYFKRHATGFDTPSATNQVYWYPYQQYETWLEDIWQTVADRSTFDTEMIPSNEALYYITRRDHGGSYTCGGKETTRTKWSLSQSLTMVGHSVSISWLFLWDMPENMEIIRVKVFTYF